MKTLLLYVRNSEFAFNTSVAALAGVARRHGFACAAYGIADGERVDDALAAILAHEPDTVCATFMSRDLLGFRALLPRLKQARDVFTAVGGYHTTARATEVAAWDGIDAIGIGEGERAFLTLLQARARGKRPVTLPGLWVRGPAGFTDPIPAADPEPRISDLPAWDYEVFGDPLVPGEDGRRYLVTRTSRACPFACTYCSVPMWERTNGLRQREFLNVRPVAEVCAELARLRDTYHPTDIEFWDPQFRFERDWLAEFAERFPAEVGLPFRVLMHAKTLNRERIGQLARAGCTQIYCGIESGDFDFRKQVLNKSCSDADIINTTAWIREAGIKASAFVMWNMPGETRAQAEKTLAMIERIRFDHLRVNSYIPLVGTSLGDALVPAHPEAPVEVFEPLPEWRDDRFVNRSAMNDEDFRVMFREFSRVHNRYGEQADGSRRGEHDQRRRAVGADGRLLPAFAGEPQG